MDVAEVGARRFAAQHVGHDGDSIIDAVRRIVAVQAQTLRGAELAVRARSALETPSQLHALINSGELVLSWLNRSTLHLVAREDYWPLHAIVAPAGLRRVGQRFRLAGLGSDEVARALDSIRVHLAGGDALPKAALAESIRNALPSSELNSVTLASLIEYSAALGDVVRGPLDQTEPLYIDAVTWLGPRPADLTNNLSHISARYSSSHAESTADDLAYWLGIGKREVREAWAAPPTRAGTTEWTGLLGPFDPLLHGWPDRTWILGEHANRVVSTNGVFRPTVIVNNRCVGIWSHARNDVTLELFDPITAPDQALINIDVERVRAFIAAG